MVELINIKNVVDDIVEKCGKPHISSLPYDLRTNDLDKIKERKDTILKEMEKEEKTINHYHKSLDRVQEEYNASSERSKELNKLYDELTRMNSRYANNYAKKFDSAYLKFSKTVELYSFLERSSTNLKVLRMKSNNPEYPEILYGKIANKLSLLKGNIFRNGLLISPAELERLNSAISDMKDYYSIEYKGDLIPHFQEIYDRSLKNGLSALSELEGLTEIPKEYIRLENKIKKAEEKHDKDTEYIEGSRKYVKQMEDNLLDAMDRLEDYKRELNRINEKYNI